MAYVPERGDAIWLQFNPHTASLTTLAIGNMTLLTSALFVRRPAEQQHPQCS